MLKIKVDLIELEPEEATAQGIKASALNDEKMTESDRLARDILAPLAVRELMIKKGNHAQVVNSRKLGEMFRDCGAVCGGALWFCGDDAEARALTLSDGFRVYAFGRTCPGACFVLILRNNKEEERAHLVRPSWN